MNKTLCFGLIFVAKGEEYSAVEEHCGTVGDQKSIEGIDHSKCAS